ncbi:surface carbohydrate biosynthesis protein [Candidatus Allofournierella excrementigallinarum]|uniref:surface carbohydrate biosynthesis protein n=1 Tax=Candidatus Allofournierella excrementigallinarum TaxID=2838592 RepID=UPI00374F6FF0
MGLDFLILYEHTVREYESDLLLKLELERRGYTAEIRQLLDRKKLKYFTWKKPKVLVSSCMYDNEAINSHVYNNVGRCDRIVNLHWEQMLSDTQEAGDWFNMNGNAKKCVQTCWGRRTAQRLIDHGMEEKNTPVTGAVMMDFLRPEFAGYFKSKEQLCAEHGLDPAKKLHLYISSFGYASMTDAEVKELSEMAGTDFSGFAATNRVSMAETLDWFDRYLAGHPEVELVYRRHPSEWNSPALAGLSQKRPNFHVIFSDSVKQWIVAADSISIWMSTAIAEVYMAGKSCHILRPAPIEHEYDPVIYAGAKYVTNYEDFAAALAEDAPPFPIERQVIEGYFDPSPVPAYKRMADLLEQVRNEPPRDAPMGEGFTPHFNWLKFFALWGVHILFALRLEPKKVFFFHKGLAGFAQRIYGYVEKAYVPKADAKAMEARIAPFVK